jgi:hypothetical protein
MKTLAAYLITALLGISLAHAHRAQAGIRRPLRSFGIRKTRNVGVASAMIREPTPLAPRERPIPRSYMRSVGVTANAARAVIK